MHYAQSVDGEKPMNALDPEAAQLLRRAIQLGDPGRTTIADLRRAIEHPVAFTLPPARLRGDAPLAGVLRRAMELAGLRSSELVSRADLLEALAETEAVAAGLNLDRLRFVRWYVQRAYGETTPAERQPSSRSASPLEPESA
jgi:hypothetical protein